MTMKSMIVTCVAALSLAGTAFAEAPKVKAPAVDAKMQAELRKAWQQGFEQGYQRANAYRDNQQAQKRAKFMAERQKKMAERQKAKDGKKAEGKAAKAQAKGEKQRMKKGGKHPGKRGQKRARREKTAE